MTENISACEALIQAECAMGTEKFGKFHSRHEGLGVIEEEVWELDLEHHRLNDLTNELRRTVFMNNYRRASAVAEAVYVTARDAMVEAMQVAAMAQKFLGTFGVQEDTS